MSAEYEAAVEVRASIDSMSEDITGVMPNLRETYAGLAMQSLLICNPGMLFREVAREAVEMSDALVKALNTEVEK